MTNDLKQNANAYGDAFQCELQSTKTLVNKRTILTTRTVRNVTSKVQICVKTTAVNGCCVQCERKCQISQKLMLTVSATECFRILVMPCGHGLLIASSSHQLP